MKPDIQILTETENKLGWEFAVRVFDQGKTHDYTSTLSWQDYELWCKGAAKPENVITAAFEYLLTKETTSQIMAKFDCSIIRRYFPQVDQELPPLVRHHPSF